MSPDNGVPLHLRSLVDVTDELEAHIRQQYHFPNVHPANLRKYERDIELVWLARHTIALLSGQTSPDRTAYPFFLIPPIYHVIEQQEKQKHPAAPRPRPPE